MRKDSPSLPREHVERPVLLWQRSGAPAVEYNIWPERPVTIGRDNTNTISIESPFVSKAHAIFQYSGGQFVIEDLRSANGTKLNGQSIEVSIVSPGDVIEIGDERLLFIDRAVTADRAVKKGLSKNARLALTAIGTLGVMGLVMSMVLPSGETSGGGGAAKTTPVGGRAASGSQTAASTAAAAPVSPDSPQVREVLERAGAAGVKPVDALYDQGLVEAQAGRLRQAAQLFAAVLVRDPNSETATRRLQEVRERLERVIADHTGEADRAFSELRYDASALEWEQVLLLTDPADPRHQRAQAGFDRARQRSSR
jgi:hypothetical protein